MICAQVGLELISGTGNEEVWKRRTFRKAAGATQVSEFQSPPSIHSPINYQLLKRFSIKVPFEIGEVMDYSVCLVFAYDFFPLVTNERELLFSCVFLFYFFDSL